MSKILVFGTSILSATSVAALFGVIHDQITYSLSSEYYTLFKFPQFRLSESQMHDRIGVALVGLQATWWVGTGLGVILSTLALIQKTANDMAYVMIRSMMFVVVASSVAAFLGGIFWRAIAQILQVSFWLPAKVENAEAFYQVGMIHNFSYLGAALGAIIAFTFNIAYRIRK